MAKGTSQRRNSGSTRQKPASGRTAKDTARNAGSAGGHPAEHVSAVALNSPQTEARSTTPAPKAGTVQQSAPAAAAAAGASATPSPIAKPANVAAARTNSTGRSGQVLAGAVGGLIVLLLALALQWLVLDPMRAGSAAQEQQLMALSQEISTLEQALAQMEEERAAGAGSADGVAAFEERLGALESAGGASADVEAGLSDLLARLESVEAERQALAERITALEEEVADRSAEESINQAFAAARLKSAIDRGGSFEPALEAFAAVAPESPAVAALDDFAASGVPTRNQLAERFPAVAREMLTAVHAGAASDGMLDRLMASARSVVTVRPTGSVEGESPEAIIARMEAAIGEGDLPAAVQEWESLPEAAKTVSQDYAADLRARAEAETILNETLSAATQAVSQETN